jgi:hypothetical protein
MYHLFPMGLLKTAVPPAEAQRTQNSQRSQNADARSSMADIISSGICGSLTAQKARPSANPCLLHLSRRGSHRSSMKKPAIVFPECFVPRHTGSGCAATAGFFTRRTSAAGLSEGGRRRAACPTRRARANSQFGVQALEVCIHFSYFR